MVRNYWVLHRDKNPQKSEPSLKAALALRALVEADEPA